MDDLTDPRELTTRKLSELDYLTPSEGELEDEEVLMEQQRILTMKLARARGRRKQLNKTPSPSRKASTAIEPIQSDVSALTEPQDIVPNSHKTSDNSSTSYFVKILESTRDKRQEEKQNTRTLLSSRTYAFDKIISATVKSVDEVERYSDQEIDKRYISQADLDSALKEIKVLRLNKLFAKIKAPNFEDPKYPNWCLIGILSFKEIRINSSVKFLLLKLTDFKFEIDISIFDKILISQYNKLRIGDIVTVLNPTPFIRSSGNEFGLSIKHGYNCIMEIGHSKHFKRCSKVSKNGKSCDNNYDGSKMNMCNFHKELEINKSMSKRMEFQGSFRLNPHVNRDGVKQTMILGKPDKKFMDSRALNVTVMNDQYAPHEDRITSMKKHFKNDGSHKRFFQMDEMNEHGVVYNTGVNTKKGFENLDKAHEEQKRKDEKKSRLRDLELQKKLSQNFKEGSKLKSLPSYQSGDLDLSEKQKLLKLAFNKNNLSDIGYDPTSNPLSRGILSEKKDQSSSLLKELQNVTKNKKIDLGLSKEEQLKRKRLHSKTLQMMKRLKHEDEDYERQNYNKSVVNRTKFKEKQENLSASSSDEDVEIEIEDVSFKKFQTIKSNLKG